MLWSGRHGVTVSLSTMCLALRRAGLTQKKTLIAQEQDPVRSAAFQARSQQIDPQRLVFLDETSTPTTLTLTYGRSPRGSRMMGRVPRRRWEGITLLASLTATGFGLELQVEGAMDRIAFDRYVTHVLVPSLRAGQIVICDNLAVHKSPVARAAIADAGCYLWFLPPYSPDFNPIELAFSKLKHALRRAAPRTLEEVMTATRSAYQMVTARDVRGYFRHSGYNL